MAHKWQLTQRSASKVTKPVSPLTASAPVGHTSAQGASAQCTQPARAASHTVPPSASVRSKRATASGASSSSTAARPNARAAISSDDDAGPRPKRPLQAATHAWQAEHRLLSKRIALSAMMLPLSLLDIDQETLDIAGRPTGLSAAGAKTPHMAAAASSLPRAMPFKHT